MSVGVMENLVYYKSKARAKENGGGRGGHQSGTTVPVKQVKQVMVTLAVFHRCPQRPGTFQNPDSRGIP